MKKIIFFSIILFVVGEGYAQLNISSGTYLVVNSGTTVIANDGITATNGTIINNGTIENRGDLVNNTSSLFSSGSTGTFAFNGSSPQEITGNTDADFYGTLEIDNSSGVSLTSTSTGSDQTVNGTLTFTNGLLSLNTFDLIIGSTDPTGAGSSMYIKTNSTGVVTRSVPADGSTDVTFPVGNSSYNPLILQNSATGTTDNYSVRVTNSKPASSTTDHMVDRSWIVTEGSANGSKLTPTTQWNVGDELASFDRSDCALGLTTDNGTTYNWKTYGAASGADPYTRPGSTFTGIGTFAVGDKDFVSGNTQVSDITTANTETDCFNAVNILNIAGNETTVLVESGGDATFIASGKIIFDTGFEAEPGSTVDAHITTTSSYCGSLSPSMMTIIEEEEEDINLLNKNQNILIYPNPNTGKFSIDFLGNPLTAEIYVVNFQGQLILKTNTMNQEKIEIDLSNLRNGVYIIIIKTSDDVFTKKVIKK